MIAIVLHEVVRVQDGEPVVRPILVAQPFTARPARDFTIDGDDEHRNVNGMWISADKFGAVIEGASVYGQFCVIETIDDIANLVDARSLR